MWQQGGGIVRRHRGCGTMRLCGRDGVGLCGRDEVGQCGSEENYPFIPLVAHVSLVRQTS